MTDLTDHNDDRVRRYGAHLLATARSLGWKDGGEGALEFLMRRTREVALEDCADEIERLRSIHAWSFDDLVAMVKRILDERYPADVFTGESGDLGLRFVVALREMIRDIEARHD